MSSLSIILLGPPGAGKGTQAEQLCHNKKLLHLATGDLLRAAVANGTPVGKMAKSYMDKGLLVPDQVVIDLLIGAIDAAKGEAANGCVFDGFPRTSAQADALGAELAKRGKKIDRVILIDTPDEVIVRRLAQRRSCPDPKCGAVYNLTSKPPKKEGLCDLCGKPIIIRNDDKPETIRTRQAAYWRDTAPLIDYYTRAGLLVKVPGSGTPAEVDAAISALVDAIG